MLCSTKCGTIKPEDRGARLISFVEDRHGHDRRYAIDASKIEQELGWRAHETFETGMAKTVRWYLENRAWWQSIIKRGYDGKRIGLSPVQGLPASTPNRDFGRMRSLAKSEFRCMSTNGSITDHCIPRKWLKMSLFVKRTRWSIKETGPSEFRALSDDPQFVYRFRFWRPLHIVVFLQSVDDTLDPRIYIDRGAGFSEATSIPLQHAGSVHLPAPRLAAA